MVVIAYLAAKICLPFLLDFLKKNGIQRTNYQGKEIPLGAGLLFPVVFTITAVPVFGASVKDLQYFLYLYAIYAAALLGFLDDLLGSGKQKGLRGHFLFLYREKSFTTGTLKAVGLVGAALLVTLARRQWGILLLVEWILTFLCVNTINLLDLRPGRALKGSLLLLMIAAASPAADYRLLGIALAAIAGYASYDLKEKAMLGDAGSNTLGMICGLALLQNSTITKILLLIVFAGLHVLTEMYSLSKIIEKSPVLSTLDRWGRKV